MTNIDNFWKKYNNGNKPLDMISWLNDNKDLMQEYYEAFNLDFDIEEKAKAPIVYKNHIDNGALTIQDLIEKLNQVSDKTKIVECNEYIITGVDEKGYLIGAYFEDIN